MLEFEKKILLNEEEFSFLLSSIPVLSTVVQENFYYDTDDLSMDKSGITCRIRKSGKKYVATIKKHCFGNLNCSKETSIVAKNENDLTLFEGMNVKLAGTLSTERTFLFCNDKIRVMIDKNSYLNVVDYELEIEYSVLYEKAAEKFIEFLELLLPTSQGISKRVNSGLSKSKRFFLVRGIKNKEVNG